ncbi:resolvase-like protein [Ruminiclostridium sufflavum DSM 19573]|uniref:Resolvase-like protein n=1 Tax=Ruminiclostridium sufflavum DSM 19573 TaxID=1121337 RepID=A0A318XG96_9FIRM|nr:resolvase-like protein [Ruminiclostridium sufflavum DSM 19573]
MINDCKAGKIDVIITKSISRFTRNTLDCLNYVRMLKELGIEVIFEEDMEKWEKQINSEDILERVTTNRFINVFNETKPIERFDAGLYFKLVEKIIFYEDGVSMWLLDGTDINCE